MNKVIIYRSNYGFPLSMRDRFMNRLWYYVAMKNRLLAKIIYYPLEYIGI